MRKIILGKTGLEVTKTALGCLPLQRCDEKYAVELIRMAFEGGINFFDTANAYTDSEKKVGLALSDVRKSVVIATKSGAADRDGLLGHVENSLKMLKTDYIDLLQLHNVPALPNPDDRNSPMAGALEAKAGGMVRHIGVTTHRRNVAQQCVDSGLFETLQFPFSYISDDDDVRLVDRCANAGMGFIAMKGLAGGMLSNAEACAAFMNQFANVVPIWGMQRKEELAEWLALEESQPQMAPGIISFIEKERKELSGSFCRSCGYCMPCAVGIEIRECARMNMLLRRSPWKRFFSPEWKAKMAKIDECIGCGECRRKCPYGLDIPNLLKFMKRDYDDFYVSHKFELG